jgi:hypothetical protein
MKIKDALDNNSILFSSKEEFVEFIRECAKLSCENYSCILQRTHFRSIEDVEYFFGVFFGEGADIYGEYPKDIDFDIMKIEDESAWPKEYPCLLITACLGCLTDGHDKVKYIEQPYFVYKSDFDKEKNFCMNNSSSVYSYDYIAKSLKEARNYGPKDELFDVWIMEAFLDRAKRSIEDWQELCEITGEDPEKPFPKSMYD